MNRRKFGAKITKIANFTFQQFSSNCNSTEENDNKINNEKNNQLCHEDHIYHENNNASSYIDLDKEKKRAPLVRPFI